MNAALSVGPGSGSRLPARTKRAWIWRLQQVNSCEDACVESLYWNERIASPGTIILILNIIFNKQCQLLSFRAPGVTSRQCAGACFFTLKNTILQEK